MTFSGLHKLVLLVGGKFSAKYSELLSDTFRRVEAGDQSLINDIHSNAASTNSEDPQLRLGNWDRTHVLHGLVPMQTYPGVVSGIHKVMIYFAPM